MGPTFWQIRETSSNTSLETAVHTFLVHGDTTSAIDACTTLNCSPGCPPL